MLEKSGTIVLTQEEIESIQAGEIPLRVLEWRLSLGELMDIIDARLYQGIGEKTAGKEVF